MTSPPGRGTPRIARQINDRTALDLFADHGPLTRTQIRELTGLAQPTVIDLVKRLTADGLIEEAGQAPATGPGPRPVRYGLRSGRDLVAAADVRDGWIRATVRDVAGGLRHTLARKRGRTPLPDQIAALVRELATEAGHHGRAPAHTVVGVPGIVDRTTGDLGFSWDLPEWRSRMLAPVRERLDGPVDLVTGVHLVALAERRYLDTGRYALIWLGTGVGLTLIEDGRPYLGASGAAGQIGYMPVPGAPVLPVERPKAQGEGFGGDLQSLVGARALHRLGREEHGLVGRTPKSMITQAAQAQTHAAEAFMDELARRVAVALAVIATVMDPGLVVLHGETGVAGGAHLAARVEERLRTYSPLDTRVRAPGFTDSRNAALVGGLDLATLQARATLWGGLGERV